MSSHTVAVLGGSFDPPHVGHTQLADALQPHFNEVWIIPCGDRSDKHTMSPATLRYQMASIAYKNYQVLDIEAQNGSMIPSYFLMKRLESIYPNKTLKLVIGSDLLSTLHSWDEPERLVSEINFAVLARKGFTISEEIENEFRSKPNFQFLPDLNIIEMSSTEVRNAIKNARKEAESKEELREKIAEIGFISGEIIDIIINNNLYA
ncbi:unnamed protein product [Blepharisma stoltei]|uniref:Cytidyltransferase-like domain-containing protein n=1 Tax=Blepharisma stoltei TaxID=1481888 RepID=A0AAU9K023_9CILI|nr:unnamed protein product [Blepharisma stoltei]